MTSLLAVLVLLPAFESGAGGEQSPRWKAGVAKVVITPREPTWMAGYSARTRPAQGKLHDLWAKAIAIEDHDAHRAVLVTLDLCGIDRAFSLEVRKQIEDRAKLEPAAVVLACSHTHSGPVCGTNLITMYPLDAEQRRRIDEYSTWLKSAIVEVALQAIQAIQPASLSWEVGKADFAVNRRDNDQGRVPELRKQLGIKGAVDHDVPVLRVDDAAGKLLAVVFGYACHCTTLDLDMYNGDYAGYAMAELEARHPGATALYWAGCGADANPLPRREVAQAEQYGRELADAVDRVLARGLRPVSDSLATASIEIPLEFGALPSREEWEALTKSENVYEAARAKHLLERIQTEGEMGKTYPYPISVWRLGDVRWVFLGGEVVVDYAIRLKKNLGSANTWVTAYANDVMAYIPSLRVLKEGGYEGRDAMVYYGQPGAWSEKVEDQVIEGIRQVLSQVETSTP
jgi:hypothetical protein